MVPDFRGLDFVAARTVELDAEVKTADFDPDAPPLSAYWWQHQDLVIATQDPEPGAEVDQWDSIAVTLAPPEATHGAPVRHSPLLTLDAGAPPKEQSTVDH